MYFWRQQYFQSLKSIAVEATAEPEWSDYATYCTDYERGLRRQAFATLDAFIVRMKCAPFAERKRFVSWLMHHADGREGEHMLVPHPVRTRLVEPTCNEWIEVEPASSEPHRWLGSYDHLKVALRLDATDEIARRKFLICVLKEIRYLTHELPAGYLGDPQEDLIVLGEAQAAVAGLSNQDERKDFEVEFARQRKLIEDHCQKKSKQA
jgi:hypothetical protein